MGLSACGTSAWSSSRAQAECEVLLAELGRFQSTAEGVEVPSGLRLKFGGRVQGRDEVAKVLRLLAGLSEVRETRPWRERFLHSTLWSYLYASAPKYGMVFSGAASISQFTALGLHQKNPEIGFFAAEAQVFPIFALLSALGGGYILLDNLLDWLREPRVLADEELRPGHWALQWKRQLLAAREIPRRLLWEGKRSPGEPWERVTLTAGLSSTGVPFLDLAYYDEAPRTARPESSRPVVQFVTKPTSTPRRKQKTRAPAAETELAAESSVPSENNVLSGDTTLTALGLDFSDETLREFASGARDEMSGTEVGKLAGRLGYAWVDVAKSVHRVLDRLSRAPTLEAFRLQHSGDRFRKYEYGPYQGCYGVSAGGQNGKWRVIFRWQHGASRPTVLGVFDYHGESE